MNDDRPTATGSPFPATSPGTASDFPVEARLDTALIKAALATSLVNGLALFDFIVFGFFASMIGDRIFPFTAPMVTPLLAAATLGAGLVARPLGGLVIGAYADRRGRPRALLLSCWLASVGTAMLALCPPYARVGLAAPAIAVVARVLQGIALGGEIGPAAALVMEAAPRRRRAFLLGCQLAGNGLALLAGASLGLLMTKVLTPGQLFAWGWRAALAAGMPLIGAAYYLRRLLPEPPENRRPPAPLTQLYRAHLGTVAKAALLAGFGTVPLYAVVFFMPAYMVRLINGPDTTGFAATALCAVLVTVLAPIAGLVVDALPRRKPVVLASAAGMAIGAYALLRWMPVAGTTAWLMAGIGLATALATLGGCAATVLVLEALPREVRATGFGTAHALGAAAFGGTVPLVVAGLMKWTADPMSVAWYAVACCIVSAGAALALKECRRAA